MPQMKYAAGVITVWVFYCIGKFWALLLTHYISQHVVNRMNKASVDVTTSWVNLVMPRTLRYCPRMSCVKARVLTV